jgi:hypothetical protein
MNMSNIQMKNDAGIDIGYEFYQTIIDFDHPIQIFREAFQNAIDEDATEVSCRVFIEKSLGQEDLYIDIWDNGKGLKKENIDCFFGLAKSTKVDKNKTPLKGKLGYKGHGTKIYFKSEKVEILSRTPNGVVWGAVLDDAVKQIRESERLKYSDILDYEQMTISLPLEYKHGFYLRIKNPSYFKTQYTRYMLNHMYLRDYAKWFTVFGNIKNMFGQKSNGTLYLHGLNIDHFKSQYGDFNSIDPAIDSTEKNNVVYEKILMGHYFPLERATNREMEDYAEKVGGNKAYSLYYAKEVFKDRVYLDNNLYFDFIVYVEGYETKRRYDVLLSKKGVSSIPKNLIHTDGERYGLWACKGGVPIEKVDDWVSFGRGVGTHTYMHAFIDCDAFELNGTRGSVKNTDLEVLEKIRDKVHEIFQSSKIKNTLAERQEWEQYEKTIKSVDEDKEDLEKRYKVSQNKKIIHLPNNIQLKEPLKLKKGYSESETLMLMANLIVHYPALFSFNLLDYNTHEGIDFVVKKGTYPAYIELKGTMRGDVNHSFRNIWKFICYDIDLKDGDYLTDVEDLRVTLKVNKNDKYESTDRRFKGKKFTSYQLMPVSSVIQSMEIIVLRKLLEELMGARFE